MSADVETVPASVSGDATAPTGSEVPWRVIRLGMIACYVVGTVALLEWRGYFVDNKGVPINRELIIGWIAGMCVIATLGRRWRDAGRVLVAWAPFLFSLWLYDFARSVGYRLKRPVAVTPQIDIDKVLGFGTLPTEFLQRHLFDPLHIRWYDIAVSVVYMSHFIVPYVAAGVLWRKRLLWRWYAITFVAVTFSACVIFALYATAPPWYAARQGLIDDFPRVIAGRGWRRLNLNVTTKLITKGQQTVNPFAAIPSLHSAEALLVSVFFWHWTHKLLRPLLVAFPLAMGFTLVYAGEHYIIDVLVGWGLVVVVLLVCRWLRRRNGWADPFSSEPATSAGSPARSMPPVTP